MKNPHYRYKKVSSRERLLALTRLNEAMLLISQPPLDKHGADVGWIAYKLGEALAAIGMQVDSDPGHDTKPATLTAKMSQ